MQKFPLSLAAFAAKILPNSLKQAIYKVKPLAAFIRRGLNRAAPTGLVQVKVAAGDLAGFTILLDMQIDKDYWLGTYEPELQAALRELIQPGAVIYDVGANIGYVSLLLSKAAGETGRVYAFEALPDNAERWRKNVELNGMSARMSLFAGAVTQAAGPVRFLVHASGGMGKAAGSAGRADKYQSEVSVPGISLDEFVYGQGNPPPQVVKMDIEGGEVLALPGMRRVLAEARPLMLMELHGPESSRVAWETLTAAGYQIRWMRQGYPVVPSLEAMGWKAYIVASPLLAKHPRRGQGEGRGESLRGEMMRPRFDTAAFLWLALVLLIALSIAFLLPVTPQDYWWYLRVGRDTLASGAIPRLDTFTFTRAGTPVDYQSWGAAVLFWLVHKLGGLSLTVLLRGVILAATYSLVWLTARRAGAGRLGSALVLLVAVLASSNNWSMRPQLFAYPLFALALFILYKWQNGEKKAVWGLPLISLLWVNLHGSFVMLILLVGAALVLGDPPPSPPIFGKNGGRARGGLALAFAGVLLATLVNPRGFGAWTYVFNSLTVQSSQQFSAEWLPPVNTGWQMNIFFLWLLGFPLLAFLSPRRLDRLEWAWFLGFGFLALWGERYVIWFVFILVVLTACLLSDWEKKTIDESKLSLPALNLVLGLVFVLLPLVFLPGLRERWWTQSPPATENTPIAATDWLAGHPDLPGPLWSEIGFSSYLEFALPQRPTWIDTRFEVFPVKQWQAYKDITYARYTWGNLLDATKANLLLVSTQTQPDLLSALETSPAWCELYRDPVAVLYQRAPCGGR